MTRRWLVLEDDADTSFLLCEQLERHGIETRACASVAEAQDAVEDFEPAVVLADKHVGDTSGLDLFHLARPACVRVALLLSGERVSAVMLAASRFDGQHQKPIDVMRLLDEVEQRLEQRAATPRP